MGHNPDGALAIVALLGLGGPTALTGWAGDSGLAGDWVMGLHEGAASSMLILVGLHIAGVLVASRLHHDQLAAAMVTGRKQGHAGQAIRRRRPAVAALLLAAVLGFWAWQWHSAPSASQAFGVGGTAAAAITVAGKPQQQDQHG